MRLSELPIVTASVLLFSDKLPVLASDTASLMSVKEFNDKLNSFSFSTDTGGDDAYVMTTGLNLTALIAGMRFTIIATTGNTGACTLAIDSAGAIAIKDFINGAKADPATGRIPAGGAFTVLYDGTDLLLVNAPRNIADGIISTLIGSLGGSANYTRYHCPVQGQTTSSSGDTRYYFDRDCIIKNFTFRGGAVGMSAAAATFTIRRGVGSGAASDTTLTTGQVAITTAMMVRDSTHTLDVAAGDWIEFKTVCPASGFGAAFSPTMLSFEIWYK